MAGSSQCFANTDSTAVSELACTHFLISGGVHSRVNAHAVLLIQMEAQTRIFNSCSLRKADLLCIPTNNVDFSSNEKE